MTEETRRAKIETLQAIMDHDLTDAEWTKSSFSGGGSGDCLEVTEVPGKGYLLRHSILTDLKIPLTETEYVAYVAGVQAGQPGLVPGL
ncbi:DUF397 domain-containing protein [Streptomyces sp. NPDC058257]|uniref:DUF397 domain-containing protein n=1 Tax=Streptomyces sp. NPDC058257 TaxID=3346409 RepID=UPI0036EA5A53